MPDGFGVGGSRPVMTDTPLTAAWIRERSELLDVIVALTGRAEKAEAMFLEAIGVTTERWREMAAAEARMVELEATLAERNAWIAMSAGTGTIEQWEAARAWMKNLSR